MRVSARVVFLAILSAAGCSSSPLPPVKEIAQIRFTLLRMPDDKAAFLDPRVVNLTDKSDLVEVMDYLNTVDWSQTGTDVSVVGVPQTDGNFILIDKSGVPHSYSFYWDGKFYHTKAHRLIRGGDIDKLKQLVQRVCK